MRIQFYGKLAETLGRHVEVKVGDECSISEIRQRLCNDYPHAAGALAARVRAFVDDRFVDDSHVVAAGETVEFLPVISGG
jgi:molybdopterin converting factor small subunit